MNSTAGYDDPRWAEFGVTYRQLDYWTRHGLLSSDPPTPGSGTARRWSETEVEVAARLVRLLAAGLSLRVAAGVARAGCGVHELAAGVRIEVLP
jgi:hypothetical protein